jgi:hypothetical protein
MASVGSPSGEIAAARAGTRALRHLSAGLIFSALAVLLTWPLAAHLTTHIPGTGPDDNLQFLWNFWWMRQAWAAGLSGFFHTPYQFHPYGVDLLLHTHVAFNAFVGATLLGGVSHVTALNLTLLASFALNGFSTYLLGYRASGHWPAALLSGLFLAAHPATFKHLFGHFGHYSVWSLALFAYALLEALHRDNRSWGPTWGPPLAGAHLPAGTRRLRWPVTAGILLAVVAYVDYYLFVYACAFVASVLATRWLRPGVTASQWIPQSRTDVVLLVVAALLAATAVAIAWTGGLVATLGPVRVSLRTGTNVRAVATAAALVWLWRRWRPKLTVSPDRAPIGRDLRVLVPLVVACGLLMTPLLVRAFSVWRAGQYVSQTYLWRTAPAGVDPFTLVLGNPFNVFWGEWVSAVYRAANIFAFDGPLWSGIAVIVLLATWRAWSRLDAARVWLTTGVVFLLWSLGPYLVLFGVNTGMPLPGILLRYVPIVSNARLPARALVFTCLAAAVLLALAIARSPRLRRAPAIAALGALVLVDFWPALPLHRLERPAVYGRLAAEPPGAVVEVPVGIRDSFGETGRIDTTVLFHQSIHGRPIAGGYVSRIPPAVRERYERAPVFEALVKRSGGDAAGAPPVTGSEARDFLSAAGFAYVVVDRRLASPAVLELVLSMPLDRIDADEHRDVYRIR